MIIAGQSEYHQFTLSKSLIYLTDVFIRVGVTWRLDQFFQTPNGPQENDLDAHMWLDNGILVEHIYSGEPGDCTIFPNMCLKIDSRLGSGPETVDITHLEPNGLNYFGVYNVNYSYYPDYIPTLNELDVIVRIYDDNGLVYTISDPPPGEGNFWYSFQMDEDGVVTIIDCLINYNGSKPVCT